MKQLSNLLEEVAAVAYALKWKVLTERKSIGCTNAIKRFNQEGPENRYYQYNENLNLILS